MATPKIQAASIVLVGSFNVEIFQPHWFRSVDLIGEDDLGDSSVEVISKQISSFSLGWCNIRVVEDKFIAEATDAGHYEHLRNLVVGTFRTLEHTPLRMMGLIWRGHFELASEASWHDLGDHLVPKEPWEGIFTGPLRGGKPGMRSVIVEGALPESSANWARVKVEPSARIEFGAFVEVHEEYGDPENSELATNLIRSLESGWSQSTTRFRRVAESIIQEQEKL